MRERRPCGARPVPGRRAGGAQRVCLTEFDEGDDELALDRAHWAASRAELEACCRRELQPAALGEPRCRGHHPGSTSRHGAPTQRERERESFVHTSSSNPKVPDPLRPDPQRGRLLPELARSTQTHQFRVNDDVANSRSAEADSGSARPPALAARISSGRPLRRPRRLPRPLAGQHLRGARQSRRGLQGGGRDGRDAREGSARQRAVEMLWADFLRVFGGACSVILLAERGSPPNSRSGGRPNNQPNSGQVWPILGPIQSTYLQFWSSPGSNRLDLARDFAPLSPPPLSPCSPPSPLSPFRYFAQLAFWNEGHAYSCNAERCLPKSGRIRSNSAKVCRIRVSRFAFGGIRFGSNSPKTSLFRAEIGRQRSYIGRHRTILVVARPFASQSWRPKGQVCPTPLEIWEDPGHWPSSFRPYSHVGHPSAGARHNRWRARLTP